MPPREVALLELPTAFGSFDAHAFETDSGNIYLALVRGDVADGGSVLARVHSECLTGDALGSLRCDCGVQLRAALRAIAAEDRGVLVYATGHEGRGIGLIDKLRAYVQQETGLDTVDANLHLGLPVDARDYGDAAGVLSALGVTKVRLLSNNPAKARGLARGGIDVEELRPLPVAAHRRNYVYLKTKERRLGHLTAVGDPLGDGVRAPADVSELLGPVRPHETRPYVVVKYAQSIDGRIATRSGDARWISGEQERAVSHALRAHCDAVMVGIGTIMKDDPQLTVRLVPGTSPLRVVFDSTLRIPADARVLADDARTVVITTEGAPVATVDALRERHVGVRAVRSGPHGVDVSAALADLRAHDVECLLVEGGARVITSLLEAGVVDRLIIAIAPLVLGAGIEGVADLGIARVADAVHLADPAVHRVGRDTIVVGNVVRDAHRRPPVPPSVVRADPLP